MKASLKWRVTTVRAAGPADRRLGCLLRERLDRDVIVARDYDLGVARRMPHGFIKNRHQQNYESQGDDEPGKPLVGQTRRVVGHAVSLGARDTKRS